LSDVVKLFSINFFKKRLDPDYIARIGEYRMELIDMLQKLGSFWQPQANNSKADSAGSAFIF
jgi:hypothetical protein